MIKNALPETELRTADFFYNLPESLIAQTPLYPRDSSRLLVMDKRTGDLSHRIFSDIAEYIRPEDVLVINNSRVIPARIYGKKMPRDASMPLPADAAQAEVELLLLRQRGSDTWETLVRPGKRARIGDVISFGNNIRAEIIEMAEEGNRIVRFDYAAAGFSSIYELLDKIGSMPLPPYITEKLEDSERYQTVYSKEKGSAAAPTAGLHFTNELLEKIRGQGTAVAEVMLHVGLGTFRPVKADKITDHIMHAEYIHVDEATAALINERKAAGGRIIAVGTTSCRVLESCADEKGIIHPVSADTGIFIYPGYKWKAVDALITNFHLPESTLLMLVSSFAGRDHVMHAYETAVEMQYRFFSFGDAMFIQ